MFMDNRPSIAINEIEHYLKPMARQCINFRLDYRQVSEMFKTMLVSIAESEFAIEGKSQTDSRISLLTGVHRKDVRRLLNRGENSVMLHQHDLITKLIKRWIETSELIGDDGKPKSIPRHPHPDYSISFSSLAEEITSDIRARSLWDECVNLGLISMSEDGMVHLSPDHLQLNVRSEEDVFEDATI